MKKRSKIKITLSIFVLIIVLLSGWWLSKLIFFKPVSINNFYERILFEYALKDPQQMSELGLFGSFGRHLYNSRLSDPSFEHNREINSFVEHQLKILKSYDRSNLTKSQLLSTDILEWYLSNAIQGSEFMDYGFSINDYLGIQKKLPEYMTNNHLILDKKDAENYIKRLTGFEKYFDAILENLKLQEREKIIPPAYTVRSTISSMEGFVSQKAEENVLYINFKQKVSALKLDDKTKTRLYIDAKDAIENKVYPAYKRIISYYNKLLPATTDYIGIWRLPKGDDYYAYMIRNYTTMNMTPEETFSKLEAAVKNLNVTLKQLEAKTDAYTSTTEDAGIYSLADCQNVVDTMFTKLPKLFGSLPKARVTVQFTPNTGGTSGGVEQYNPSDINGIRPATIFVPESFLYIDPYTAKWILYHEGVPGHHLQFAINNELKGVPSFRKLIGFPAFSEGWATYAEDLPWEYGLLKTDTDTQISMTKAELTTVGRALLDAGINYKHWSREYAVKYALDNNICDIPNANYYAQFVTVYPGFELSYAMGYIEITELKEAAMTKLGKKFDIREFHDNVLKNGNIPLAILQKQINDYINLKLKQKY